MGLPKRTLKQTQLRRRATAADRKVRQDKLFKLRQPQLRGNRLPTLASSHSAPPESWTLPGWMVLAENPGPPLLVAKFSRLEKPTTSWPSVPPGPLHVLIDSTGLQVYGAGQWLEAKHGAKSRRTWRS